MPENTASPYPFISFMISQEKNPDDQIPVMGFFINPSIVIEVDINDLLEAVDGAEHGLTFPFRKLASLSNVNSRELVARVNVSKKVLDIYVGELNKPFTNGADPKNIHASIPLFKVAIALKDFDNKAEAFVTAELEKEEAEEKSE